LHHLFEVARREWDLPIVSNPLDGFSKGLDGTRRCRRLSSGAEAERIREAADKCRNQLIMPLFQFAIATGMRRGELVKAKWTEFDREKRTLHIPETKNGHPRTIPLSSEALDILDRVPRDSDLIFPLSTNAVTLAWRRLAKRAQLRDLHFHDLRHEAISRFFEKGLSVPEVVLISGHKDMRMLFRYTHLRAEDLAAKLD
jgi:integrase